MQESYVDILKKNLQERIARNPSYSLRSFSKSLDLDPGFLSHILNHKRKLSVSRAIDVASSLKISSSEKKLFVNLVRLDSARSEVKRAIVIKDILKQTSLSQIKKIDLQAFAVISNWYHHAVLELTFKENFIFNSKNIAKVLSINEIEAKLAIERLLDLGLMTLKNHKYQKTDIHLNPPSDTVNISLKNRHRQILNLAQKALDDQSVHLREFQSITMCIDESLIPEAKQRIQEFAWELCNTLESKKRKKVYELSIQLFSLESEGVAK